MFLYKNIHFVKFHSVKNQNFENRHVLSWPKLGLDLKFLETGTIAGGEKRKHTDPQDSCFVSIAMHFTE